VCVCLFGVGGRWATKAKLTSAEVLASFLFSIVDAPSEDRVTRWLSLFLCVCICSKGNGAFAKITKSF